MRGWKVAMMLRGLRRLILMVLLLLGSTWVISMTSLFGPPLLIMPGSSPMALLSRRTRGAGVALLLPRRLPLPGIPFRVLAGVFTMKMFWGPWPRKFPCMTGDLPAVLLSMVVWALVLVVVRLFLHVPMRQAQLGQSRGVGLPALRRTWAAVLLSGGPPQMRLRAKRVLVLMHESCLYSTTTQDRDTDPLGMP